MTPRNEDSAGEFSEEASTLKRAPRILLIEDDDDLRGALALALTGDGHEVLEARTGRDALEGIAGAMALEQNPCPPDAIVTDVGLPGVSGLTIVSGLRALGWRTPVIVITGQEPTKTRAAAERAGADFVLTKPFDIDDLRTAVLHVVR